MTGILRVVVAGIPALLTSIAAAQSFDDRTEQANLDVVHVPQQITTMPWVVGGMAAGDFDRDGLTDLYAVSGGHEPDRLFINNGDGTFTDMSLAWGLSELHCGNGVAVGDYDNDGWLDVYLTSQGTPGSPDEPGKNRLLRNNGNGSFSELAEIAGVNEASPVSTFTFGAAFGDYDLDGDLDLFVANWQVEVNGNRLFRNDGDGTFSDVTKAAIGEEVIYELWGFQPAFTDMDGDLFPELLIAADFESSRYFVNNRDGTFTDMTVAAGTGIDDNGMGQTIGDFDNDGHLDWYVTSIWNDNPPPWHFQGNTLYRSLGGHFYQEIAEETACKDGGWGWGTIGLDVDQDGWLDIIEVNGRHTDPPGEWTDEQAYFYHNDGDGTFTERAIESGLTSMGAGRAIVWLDSENDGDLDVAIFNNSGRIDYFQNNTPDAGHWLQIELDTSGNPLLAPDGFGARIDVTAGGLTQARVINSSPSFLGTSPTLGHFGLGDSLVVDEIRITWSRGYVTVLENVEVDQKLSIVAPALADLNANGHVEVLDLVQLILAWGEVTDPANQLVADLNNDGEVGVQDLTTLLLSWGPG